MDDLFKPFQELIGSQNVAELHQRAERVKNRSILHVNSTREGGGVAELLANLIPMKKALGIQAEWEVIEGNGAFFDCTKQFHNLLQGQTESKDFTDAISIYEETNRKNANRLRDKLENADIVIIHDPQPLDLIRSFPKRRAKWIWRCHIDLSSPCTKLWQYLRPIVERYDGSIFSIKDYAPSLLHPLFLIAPSIHPFSEKNREIDAAEIRAVYHKFQIDQSRPILLQVSRFDRFKDPLGVIAAYQIVKKRFGQIQLLLAGGGAIDDPESGAVIEEVKKAAANDPDIHVLILSSDAHHIINALQRGADIILQKSLKEGFGLTVTEALWKSKPVIGGNTGGIRAQIVDRITGYLVNTPEEAAERIFYLLENPQEAKKLGKNGHKRVSENFLITRHVRDYLLLMSHFFA